MDVFPTVHPPFRFSVTCKYTIAFLPGQVENPPQPAKKALPEADFFDIPGMLFLCRRPSFFRMFHLF